MYQLVGEEARGVRDGARYPLCHIAIKIDNYIPLEKNLTFNKILCLKLKNMHSLQMNQPSNVQYGNALLLQVKKI